MGKLVLILRKWFVVLCTLFSVTAVLSYSNLPAIAGPPSSGDWIVTGTEFYSDQTVVLNGSLTVEDGGNLTFQRVTLKMNCAYDGQYRVNIFSGGAFYVLEGSVITSVNPDNNYCFAVDYGATFRMNHSEVHECGLPSDWDTAGLTVGTDDAIIENSLISNNYVGMRIEGLGVVIRNNNITGNVQSGIHVLQGRVGVNTAVYDNHVSNNNVGIVVMGGNASIYNNTVVSNSWAGINPNGNAFPTVRDNVVMKNGMGIFCVFNASGTICGNTITENTNGGISCHNHSNPIIVNNTVTSNPGMAGISCGLHCELTIQDNKILANGMGIGCDDSVAEIQGNDISQNGSKGSGIVAQNSDVTIQDNTLSQNEDAISLHNSSALIQFNNISSSIHSGISVDDNSNATIRNNDIRSTIGDAISCSGNSTGIISENNLLDNINGVVCGAYSSPFIKGNNITNNGGGHGVGCSYFASPIIEGNNIRSCGPAIGCYDRSNPLIQGNTIVENQEGIACDGYSNPIIQGNRISQNTATNAPSHRNNGIRCENGSKPEVHWNEIYGNAGYGIRNNDPSVTVNATYNYWGSIDGPVQASPDAVDPEEISQNILYNPWQTEQIIFGEIKNPLEGETVSATITVSAAIRAVNGIHRVEFLVDSQLKYTCLESPYEWSWNTSEYSETSHEIQVTAYDIYGLKFSGSQTVFIDNTSPAASIKEPLSGSMCGGTVTISVNATDNREVSNVRVKVDNDAWLVMTYSSADSLWKYDFNTTTLPDGQHTIMSLALDKAGNPATTSITVLVDNNPPTLTIQNPTSGMTVGLTLIVNVIANDMSNISRIEFFLQDVLVYTIYNPPYQWSWDTTKYPNGEYAVTVKAYDTFGNSRTSSTTVAVKNVELPWWQTQFWTLIQVLVALGGLALALLTYLSRKEKKKSEKKEES